MTVMVLSSHTPSLIWFRLDMMVAFKECGHKVVAVGNEDETTWSDRFQPYGIKYRKATIERNGTNPFKDLKTMHSLREIMRQERPDKIFAYNAKTVIYGGLAAHKERIAFYPLIAGLGSVFMGRGLKNRLVRTILKIEYKQSLKHSRRVFFQNQDDVDVFVKKRMVREEKVAMLHGSGVNLEAFKVQKLPDRFGFLYIGRLIRDKGVFEYLEACRIVKQAYPTIRCLLVGPFDSNPSALKKEELKSYLDDGTVEYFGEQTDVRPFLAQCCVFVLPSYREGTPKTVLEAMASYKAVITSDAPGCRETVIDGENGYLVPVKDPVTLAKKMIALYEQPDLIKAMAERGRKMAEDLFDVNKINEKIVLIMKLKEETNEQTV